MLSCAVFLLGKALHLQLDHLLTGSCATSTFQLLKTDLNPGA